MDNNLKNFLEKSYKYNVINKEWYQKYEVKNGLRNEDGTGVLVGLTKVSDVVGYKKTDGKKVDDYGRLIYRGIDIEDIINNNDKRYLFEEVSFLILFGYLPSKDEFDCFKKEISAHYLLPDGFLENKILRSPSNNLMNKLQQDVLTLFNYDPNGDDTNVDNVLNQGINLISKMVCLVCYNYMSKINYFDQKSMYIHHIDLDKSISENLLSLLRVDQKYTKEEASLLDVCLLLHADHGGGNNSTFVNVVISSTGTDLYSSFAGSIGSLKGPKHGGANIQVSKMMDTIIDDIGITTNENDIRVIIKKLLNKDYFDCSGLVYGMGHAVYTLSDPRSEILKNKAKIVAQNKGLIDKYNFYCLFEKIAKEEILIKKGIHVCSNVDFYSGLVYQMLGIDKQLYTLLFVVARSVGWLAHNIESQLYSGKIVRPATKYVGEFSEYIDIEKR
ncbi:MAG: citrate synthase [Erysipelotrichaceae bacterium]